MDNTLSLPFKVACAADATDASFPSRIPTITEPLVAANAGLIDFGKSNSRAPNNVLFLPFGAGNDDETFSIRVLGWRKVAGVSPNVDLWIPVVLCEVLCTLGTAAGVAATQVDANHKFADLVSLTTGNANVSVETFSVSGNLIQHFVIDAKGFVKLELTFAKGSTTSGMNALWAGY